MPVLDGNGTLGRFASVQALIATIDDISGRISRSRSTPALSTSAMARVPTV